MRKLNLLLLAVLGFSMMACDDDEEYRGDWAKGVSFGGEPRTGSVSFVIDNIAYVGLGYGVNNVEFNDFYKFSNGGWMRQQDTLVGPGRHGAVAFVIDKCAYVGLGYISSYTNYTTGLERPKEWLKDFYKFDATTGVWTRLPDFPGNGRRDAVAFSIGGYGYVGTGRGLGAGGSSEMPYKDFYCFDPTTNTWKEISYAGAARYGAVAFVIGGAAHVCTGMEDNSAYATDHYVFTPGTNGDGTWLRRQSLLDKPRNRQDAYYNRIPRVHAVSFIASNNEEEKDYAYIATGYSNVQYTWWYDHVRDLWHEVEDLPIGRAPSVRQAVAFTLEEGGIKRGYFTTGGTTLDANPVSQTWYFIPNIREDRGNDY
jgi:N-acetylneuraminic acid mutarotase